MTEAELFDLFVQKLPEIWGARLHKRGVYTEAEAGPMIRKWFASGGFAGDLRVFKESHA